MNEAIDLTIYSLINLKGGEIFVPKIPSFRIIDLAKAVCEKCIIKIIGIRPGEKIHEEMISSSDSKNTFDLKKYYAIVPENLMEFYKEKKFNLVEEGFSYNSKSNKFYLTKIELKKIIKTYLIK